MSRDPDDVGAMPIAHTLPASSHTSVLSTGRRWRRRRTVRAAEATRTVIFLQYLELLELRLREHGAQLLQGLGLHLFVIRAHLVPRWVRARSPRLLEQRLHLCPLFLQDRLQLSFLAVVEIQQRREAIHPLRLTGGSLLGIRDLGRRHTHCTEQDGREETRFHGR